MRLLSSRALLAALLALAQALAPFAHRAAAASPAGWIEVCSANGARLLPAGDMPAPARHDGDHCVLCRPAEPMAGLPALPLAAAAEAPGATTVVPPAPALVAAPTLHDAPARAPPVGT